MLSFIISGYLVPFPNLFCAILEKANLSNTNLSNASLSYADLKDAILDEKEHTALAIVNDENLSLAIGKKGSNIRLASKLTKWKIEIKSLAQINEEGNK